MMRMTRTRRALMVGMTGAMVLGTGGCLSRWIGGGDPQIAETGTFLGPAIDLTATDEFHVVSMRAPNPGWEIEFDRAQKTPGPTRLLMTVRRPDPTLIFPQRVVDKTMATTVPASELAEVFARVVDHGARKSDESYKRVILGTGPE